MEKSGNTEGGNMGGEETNWRGNTVFKNLIRMTNKGKARGKNKGKLKGSMGSRRRWGNLGFYRPW